ncbi:MAG: hypothetical protein E7207_02115 [Clostridium butyricum]|nr:hypothetical protein [Clostridium butyricum]
MGYVESLIKISGKTKSETLQIFGTIGKDTFDKYKVNIVSLIIFKKDYKCQNIKCGDIFLHMIGDSYIQTSTMSMLDFISASVREDILRQFGPLKFERIYIDEIADIIGNTQKENEFMHYEDLTWYKGKLIPLIYNNEDKRIMEQYNIIKQGSSYMVPIDKIKILDDFFDKSYLFEIDLEYYDDIHVNDNINILVYKLNDSENSNGNIDNCFAIMKTDDNFNDLGMKAIFIVQTHKSLKYDNRNDVDKVLKSLANEFSSYKNITITYIEPMNKEECEDYIIQLENNL